MAAEEEVKTKAPTETATREAADSAPATAPANSPSYTPSTAPAARDSFEQQYNDRRAASESVVNNLYDDSLATQRGAYLDAYNRNAETNAQAGEAMRENYGEAATETSYQYRRGERGMDAYAAARGLNYGEGSQQELGLNRARQSVTGSNAAARDVALQENARQGVLLETNYKNQIAQAIADNDYERAVQLYNNWNNQNSWLENNAAILAGYGDFSGYGQLYGPNQAAAMKNMWSAQNPDLAYNTGAITAQKYHDMTGKWPAGYDAGTNGGTNPGDTYHGGYWHNGVYHLYPQNANNPSGSFNIEDYFHYAPNPNDDDGVDVTDMG